MPFSKHHPALGCLKPDRAPEMSPPRGEIQKHNVPDGLSLHSQDTAPNLKNIVGANDHGLGLHIFALWGYIFWVPAGRKNRFPHLR